MENVCAVALAAGNGKRMKSSEPKVLCEVLFKPMISWVTDCVENAGIKNACVVVGPEWETQNKRLPRCFATAVQTERKGTGHAVMMAVEYIKSGGFSDVIVLYGDAPFITPGELENSFRLHREAENDVTVLTAMVKDPSGYGRIVRDGGNIKAIVEQSDADEETRQIGEINSGVYWFRSEFLLEALENLSCDNSQGEYYLTDAVAYAVKNGFKTGACVVSSDTVLGANDRKSLSELNQIALDRVIDNHLENGVNIPFRSGVVIGMDVEISPDTTILPGTIIKGKTVIGSGCEIGPNSHIENATIGNDCKIQSTYIDDATLENGVKIGPMSNVRPGSHIGSGAKIGDFVEIKNSNIGEKTAVSHLTYIGDSDVGGSCNFGCGVVTVNYDSINKHRTTIGDNVFVGCNTNLVAPVKMGDRSYSAAGTTVTEDVPEDALVIGRVRQTVKPGWTAETGKYSKK